MDIDDIETEHDLTQKAAQFLIGMKNQHELTQACNILK